MPPAAVAPKPTVLSLAEDLAAGRTTSRALIEAALTRIADTAGEGARTFIKVYSDTARAAADAQDRLRAAGYVASPLAGLPVSIKDLFDVAGERTLAGSKALDDMPPAQLDAPVVARLRAAGAILIGRTNMTEFAFSGVGINPHYGTPGNPHDRSCIPGGSSSGAAVSVADGGAIVAIGTDTGGSVRIPAALCGIVGLKPTQTRISRAGATPLSTTLELDRTSGQQRRLLRYRRCGDGGRGAGRAAAGPGRGIAPWRAAKLRPRRSRTGGGDGVRRRLHEIVARPGRGSSICR